MQRSGMVNCRDYTEEDVGVNMATCIAIHGFCQVCGQRREVAKDSGRENEVLGWRSDCLASAR